MEVRTPQNTEELFIGRTLSERYNILSCIGKGGMGNVYLAEHALLKKKVALKILHMDQSQKTETLERFRREAIAASNIGQNNIVDVTDFGYTSEGNAFFVMEYIEGDSLSDIIKNKAPLPLHYVVATAAQISLALFSAHGKGIIHRDLKPENILITTKGEIEPFVKIVDFGISKITKANETIDQKEKALTKAGAIFGTPEYMSPEQAAGRNVDPGSDIYSLGVIMYEMITGKLPFIDDNYMKILHKHQYEIPALPSSVLSKVPEEMDKIILRCLEKNSVNRYGSMMELLVDLKRVYATYNLDKKVSLSFLFESTSITRVESQENKNKKVDEKEIVKILNKGSIVDQFEKEKKGNGLRIFLAFVILILMGGILFSAWYMGEKKIEKIKPVSKYNKAVKVEKKPVKKKIKSRNTAKKWRRTKVKTKASPRKRIKRKTVPKIFKLTVQSNFPDVDVVNKETGKYICTTPCAVHLPRKKDGVMLIGFEKEGFKIKPMAIRQDQDMKINVKLTQE